VGGAPLALPARLDVLSDRWWGLAPRTRTWLVLLAVTAALSGAAIRAAASPYGPPVPVLVAAHDLAAGVDLADAPLHARRWPADLVPTGSRREASGTLAAPLPAGAVLTDGHVTDGGLAALLGDGRSAVPLPAELVPDLPIGTIVQVVATGLEGEGTVLADRAEVIATDDRSLWVAVTDAAAADVASAGLRGSLALAVRSVSGPDP
jgi:pilus assembly protein CpaB